MMLFLRKLLYGRMWPNPWALSKVVSDDGLYYFVPRVAMKHHPHGGWLQTSVAKERLGDHWMSSMDWLPFAFWKVRSSGHQVSATVVEVRAYRERMAGLVGQAGEVPR